MIILSILFLFLIAYAAKKDKAASATKTVNAPAPVSQKELDRMARERAREMKAQQKKEQAMQDLPFYEIQLERIQRTAEDLRQQYYIANDSVNHDLEMNSYGAVIRDEVVNKHISERDRILKKLITAENAIHALEKKIYAAETVLNAVKA